MNELIYYQNQYQKELEARVLKVEGNKILLDKTIFIPASNTEPGDLGKINDIKIKASEKKGDEVWHILPGNHSLKEGDSVKLELDWDNRLKMMRLHSALHLFAGPFDKNFGKRPVAGAIKGNEAYLVFKEEIPDEIINSAIEQINKDLESGLEIKSYWDEKREGFRWTQVGDYLPIPDGGLHVKNVKEIGKIILKDKKLDDGKQKLVISII